MGLVGTVVKWRHSPSTEIVTPQGQPLWPCGQGVRLFEEFDSSREIRILIFLKCVISTLKFFLVV